MVRILINGHYIHNQSVSIRQGDQITLGTHYKLSWRKLMWYFGNSHITQRDFPAPHTVRDGNQHHQQVAQQININVGGHKNTGLLSVKETPKCLNQWSWGAFSLNWIWGLGNGVFWPLVMLIPYVGQLASLIIIFILGANGNRYAWEKFSGTADEFDAKQKSWTTAGVIVFIIQIFIGIIIGISMILLFISNKEYSS